MLSFISLAAAMASLHSNRILAKITQLRKMEKMSCGPRENVDSVCRKQSVAFFLNVYGLKTASRPGVYNNPAA